MNYDRNQVQCFYRFYHRIGTACRKICAAAFHHFLSEKIVDLYTRLFPLYTGSNRVKIMNARERLIQTLNHREPDRLVVDIGAGGQTGMGVCAVHNLRKAMFGEDGYRVKVTEPYQMLGEMDEDLRQALHLDVAGVHPPKNMFGFRNERWKSFTMPDGTVVDVPGDFNVSRDEEGYVYMHADGEINT